MLSGGAGHYRAEECDHDTIASLVRIYTFYARLTTNTATNTSIPATPQVLALLSEFKI